MDEENREQQTTAEEQTAGASEGEQQQAASGAAKAEASEGKGESQAKTYTEAEVQEMLKGRQSLKDKELKPLYKELEDMRVEAKKLKEEREREKAEAQLASQEKEEAEQWETEGVPEKTVKGFQETRRELAKKVADYNGKVPEIRRATAYALAMESLKEILPDGEKTISVINDLLSGIAEGESEREMRALARVKALELKGISTQSTGVKPPENTPKKRPDPGASSAPGGIDLSKLSSKELLNMAYSKKK